MIVLIVAGGSGTRLWPLSTPDFPKHLLNIIGDRSLLQNTYDRARQVTGPDKIYISTEVSHVDHIYDQVPELDRSHVIVEPARRDTMPCIMNAIQFISTLHDENEPIASIHADHHIRDVRGFAQALIVAGHVSTRHNRITLLGMEPSQPDSKYGYIHKGEAFDSEQFVYKINKFKEKPPYETARKYFESGEYLWNMGYFVAPYSIFRQSIVRYADSHWSDQLNKLDRARTQKERDDIYLDFNKEPVDIALMEKLDNLLVMPGNFDWMDVGSFDDVHRVSVQDQHGNAIHGDNVHILDSEQVYVRNEGDSRPVAVVGMDNTVVINTPTGVLVMRTDQAQKVKEIVSLL